LIDAAFILQFNMKTKEVFTPGTLPKHTYYDRSALQLEQNLLDAVDTPGIIAAVSGPSKSGKTVLCESVVGLSSMLLVTGGGIDSEETLWKRIRSKLKIPSSATSSSSASQGREIGGSAKAGLGFILKGEGGVNGKISRSEEQQSMLQFDSIVGVDLLQEVKAAGKTLVVDDFHYIERGVQVSIVEQFKEAARAGSTIVVVSVPHRSDDVIRANPDLRGRLRNIEVPYWSQDELCMIANLGFPKLHLSIPETIVKKLAMESISSPQLMQNLCLELCRSKGIDEAPQELKVMGLGDIDMGAILRSVASSSSCQTALDILIKGPRVRGTERKTYNLQDGSSGDVYTVILKAVATGEPKLAIKYPEIRDRTASVTTGEGPAGSSIVSSLEKMDEAAREMKQGDRIIEWDSEKETLNFPDPYLLYFLRWRNWN
jgi:hypothetical protein